MEKVAAHTANLVQANIEAIAELFPHVVTEALDAEGNIIRAIDFDALRQELSDHVVEGPQERYLLDWPGKRAAILAANAPTRSTLRPMMQDSVNFEVTKNLFIEGDNLEALRILRESYLGKVKLIYIDPPYNTGNDFIYRDDFSSSIHDYLEVTGQVDPTGSRLTTNTESNGRYHSDWMSMMYSRLKIARDFLTEDGSIFVSIDFNEAANLKRMMDEIFGEKNFQRQIIWRIGWLSGYKTMANNFIRNHDVILFYSRAAENLDFKKLYIENRDFKPLVRASAELKVKLADLGLNREQQTQLLNFINHENRPERYPLEDTWNSNEYDDLNSIAIVSFSGEKISKLLGIEEEFKGQKSIRMLRRILQATTAGDDVVMDFFAGTGSTAHAVMELNAEDGSSRRFIMIQVPEMTSEDSAAHKGGYSNIAQLARARLNVVGKTLVGENTSEVLDVGYRAYRVHDSAYAAVHQTPDDTEQESLEGLMESVRPERSAEDLLAQVMLDLGVELSLPITLVESDGSIEFDVDNGALICCFAGPITSDVARSIATRRPLRAVFSDVGFASDTDRINVEQIFRELSPGTQVKVI